MPRQAGRPGRARPTRTPPRDGRRVALKDVADAAGLSIAHVSRALSDYDDVAESTRTRVRKLAAQLGYRPSRQAQTLRKPRQPIFRCAIVTMNMPARWIETSLYGPTVNGILAVAAAEGLDLQLAALGEKNPVEDLAQFLAEDRADGIVLLTHQSLLPEHLAPIEDAGVPYVLANRHFAHHPDAPLVNCVTPDWPAITRDAVIRLHRLGHRRLVAILPTRWTSTTRDMEQGWHEGVAACGLDPTHAPVVPDRGLGQQVTGQLLRRGLPETGERPTAIVAHSDRCANGALRAARELAVSVPQELSVTGADNTIGAELWPPLCTYEPNFYLLGEEAGHLLTNLLRSETRAEVTPRRITLPIEFICRSTCGPPPPDRPAALDTMVRGV